MTEEVYLDMLTRDSVSIKRQKYIVIEDVDVPVGEPWRKTYYNSTEGRTEVGTEVEEPYKTAIMIVWGDAPTMS